MMKISIKEMFGKINFKLLAIIICIGILNTSCNGSGGSATTNNTYNINNMKSSGNGINTSSTSVQQYVYVTNYGGKIISMYKVEPTGELTPLETPSIATENNPIAIAISQNKQYAYVVNFGSNSISMYSINQDNGILAQISNPLSAPSSPSSIAIAPNGKDVYIVSYANNGTLSHYIINEDGTLQLSSEVTTCTTPTNIKINHTGQFAYVTCFYNTADGNVYSYSIDQITGPLNFLSGVYSGGAYPTSMAIAQSEKFMYVSSGGNGTTWISLITMNAYNTLTGSMQQLDKSEDPAAITLSKDDAFAYTANYYDGKIGMFRVNPDNGTLTHLTTPTINANAGTISVVVDENNQYVYAANYQANTVSMFMIDQTTGMLTALPTKSIASGKYPAAIATVIINQ